MSKLGSKAIFLPKETTVTIERGKLIFSGSKGKRELKINDKIFSTTLTKENYLLLKPVNKSEEVKILWGTTRSIVNSAIVGVSNGFEKILEMNGVGYRATLKGSVLNLQLGFSHDSSYDIPEGIKITVEKQTVIKIFGIDKQLVGSVAADIKSFRPAEPYKGKGIKEKGQYVLRKEGKKK